MGRDVRVCAIHLLSVRSGRSRVEEPFSSLGRQAQRRSPRSQTNVLRLSSNTLEAAVQSRMTRTTGCSNQNTIPVSERIATVGTRT